MEWFWLPTPPVVYSTEFGQKTLCIDCPEFAAKCDGSASGEHPQEVEELAPLSPKSLNGSREVICRTAIEYLEDVGVPLAVRLGVVPAARSIVEMAQMPSVEPNVTKSADPKALTRMYLRSLIKNVATLESLPSGTLSDDGRCLDLMFLVVAQQNCVAGLLAGMDSAIRKTTLAGAKGRKRIGEGTKERIRSAAMSFRGLMSKDDAAARIAPQVGRSAAHVRKVLSAIFPGDSWASP